MPELAFHTLSQGPFFNSHYTVFYLTTICYGYEELFLFSSLDSKEVRQRTLSQLQTHQAPSMSISE